MSELGSLVAAARRRRKLSQQALGALLCSPDKPKGVWATYIGQIERGKRVPPDAMALQLAEVLELDPQRVLAAAYQSRAHTPLGQSLFALAPVLLFVRRHAGPDCTDIQGAVRGLQRLADPAAGAAQQRLLEALADLEPLDESRWNLFRNALAAVRAAAPGAPGADA